MCLIFSFEVRLRIVRTACLLVASSHTSLLPPGVRTSSSTLDFSLASVRAPSLASSAPFRVFLLPGEQCIEVSIFRKNVVIGVLHRRHASLFLAS